MSNPFSQLFSSPVNWLTTGLNLFSDVLPSGLSSILDTADNPSDDWLGWTFEGGRDLTPTAAPEVPSGGSSGILDTVQNLPWSSIIEKVLPIAGLGTLNYLGSRSQSDIMEGVSDANNKAYQQYLANLQVPEAEKEKQFAGAKQAISASGSQARRRLANTLASRGIRGQGVAAPFAAGEREQAREENKAYLDIYGNYNTPQAIPPATYAPSTGDLFTKQSGDLATAYLMKILFGQA